MCEQSMFMFKRFTLYFFSHNQRPTSRRSHIIAVSLALLSLHITFSFCSIWFEGYIKYAVYVLFVWYEKRWKFCLERIPHTRLNAQWCTWISYNIFSLLFAFYLAHCFFGFPGAQPHIYGLQFMILHSSKIWLHLSCWCGCTWSR